jgi:hypothetical protein
MTICLHNSENEEWKIMNNFRLLTVAGICIALLFIAGCARTDFSSGRTFTDFVKPPEGKAVIYLVRDDNWMANGLAETAILGVDLAPTEPPPHLKDMSVVAIVDKVMYVPILATPGDYYFSRVFTSERISVKSGDIVCIDIGTKYRGVFLLATERIESLDECKKIIMGKKEGVQLREAQKRMGEEKAQGLTPEVSNAQIVMDKKMKW